MNNIPTQLLTDSQIKGAMYFADMLACRAQELELNRTSANLESVAEARNALEFYLLSLTK